MANIIEIKGHHGIKFYCTQEQWDNHIVNEFTGHPMMKYNVDAIVETLKDPDYVHESHDSDPPLDYREVYSKDVESATYHNVNPYTRVIVCVCGGSGEIITTYPGNNPASGTKGDAIYVKKDDDNDD